MNFLFLDFDGVLFDTVEEAYQVCINTNQFKNFLLPKNSFKLFKLYRPLVGPAWNYYYLMNSIIKNEKINSNNFTPTEQVRVFEKDFFTTRDKLKQNYKEWLKLNKKYSFTNKMINFFKENNYFFNNFAIYIITTKDTSSVKNILQVNNINFIKYSNIFDKESFDKYNSKGKIISNILKNKKDYNAIFIDDSLSHLVSCQDIKDIRLIQAKWGYINKKNISCYIKDEDSTLHEIKNLIQKG